ncbi:MAG: hypothetical protein K2X93_22120 [Candidatus Obscuribacterales bacterium]|nr:hypothetical protein [Candidatus Obscuribacterales bacterium]
MYWRVRKITPEQMLKQYSVHVILAISLLGNAFLFISRPKKEAMDKQMKLDFVNFSKQVTNHLLDTSYINYIDSTSRLQAELSDAVKGKLRQDGILPSTEQELKANLLEFSKSRRVCALQFQAVDIKEPNPQGLVPIEVSGTVAVHSADESAQQPFHLMYMVGLSKKTEPPSPIVVDMKDLPPPQAGGAQQGQQ